MHLPAAGGPVSQRSDDIAAAELLTIFQLSSDSCPDTEEWGRRAAAADLGDKLVVPVLDQAGVLVLEIEDGEDLLDECFVFWVVDARPPDDLRLGGGSSVGPWSSAAGAGAGEGVEVLAVGFGEGV